MAHFQWGEAMGAGSLRAFPTDIEYHIVDLLHDDKQALAACSFVNRAWLYNSRRHLFHTIALNAGPRSDGDRRFRDLSRFLDQPSKTPIATHVRELELKGKLASFCNGGLTPLSISLLCELLSRLPRVDRLQLRRVQLHPPYSLSGGSIHWYTLWRRRPMQYLHLEYPAMITRRGFSDLLRLFSDIDHVSVLLSPPQPPLPPLSEGDSPRDRSLIVRSLSVHFFEMESAEPLYDVLGQSGSLDGPLHSLDFATLFTRDVAAFMPVLRRAGPHLKTLGLRMLFSVFKEACFPADSWAHLTLDTCFALESLAVWTGDCEAQDGKGASWLEPDFHCACARLLATLPSDPPHGVTHAERAPLKSHPLREFTLNLVTGMTTTENPCVFDDLVPATWAPLDQALTTFPCLARVVVAVHGKHEVGSQWVRTFQEHVQACLPGIASMGRLSITM